MFYSDLTDPFTNLLSDDEILFLSGYENVKIVEQDSNLTGQNIHPVNISEERIEGALNSFYLELVIIPFHCFLIIN